MKTYKTVIKYIDSPGHSSIWSSTTGGTNQSICGMMVTHIHKFYYETGLTDKAIQKVETCLV